MQKISKFPRLRDIFGGVAFYVQVIEVYFNAYCWRTEISRKRLSGKGMGCIIIMVKRL